MPKKIVESERAPSPVGPYSQAVQCGDLLFCSGQIAIDPTTGEVQGGDIQSQTRLAMENMRQVLSAAGLDFSNVVKTTIFLADMGDFTAMNEVYATYFTSQPPARSCVEASRLPKDVAFEIEVIASKS